MTPHLTEDQRQAIKKTGGKPVDVVDATTNVHYVLVRADQYEKVRALVGELTDIDPREAYAAIDETFREGWNDPAMDKYDAYDAHKQ